jgi:hypothetical protein
MPKDTIDETQQALADLERRPSPTPPLAIPVALLAIALLCVALSWLRQSRPGLGLVLRVPQLPGSARVIGVPSISGEPLACILTRSGAAGREDLFLCTSAPTLTCQNLTESPGLTEAWPVVDPAGQHVVYYGVGESGTDLYMLTLPNGSALPLTLHAG